MKYSFVETRNIWKRYFARQINEPEREALLRPHRKALAYERDLRAKAEREQAATAVAVVKRRGK